MLTLGVERAARKEREAIKRGEPSRLEKRHIGSLIPVVAAHLQSLLEAAQVPGRRPVWVPALAAVDLDLAAGATLRIAFAQALKRADRNSTLPAFGLALETILLQTAAVEATGAKARQVLSRIAQKTTLRARQAALARVTKREVWSEEQKTQAGAVFWNAAMLTGLFDTMTVSEGSPRERVLWVLSEAGQALLDDLPDLSEVAMPVLRPMVVPPRPWEGLWGGAYLTPAVADRMHLVRTRDHAHQGMLSRAMGSGRMQPVVDAVNSLQSVPLRINEHVLALRDWAWGNLVMPGTLPLRTPVAVEGLDYAGRTKVPACLQWLTQEEQARWWHTRTRARRVNGGIAPNRAFFEAMSGEAEELVGQEVYLPTSMDYRGRVYPIPSLSHHAGDAQKALFEFSRGVELGEAGLWWLKVHVATCADAKLEDGTKTSKAPFWRRVAWTEANLELVQATAENPTEDHRWADTDAPFSFYAACVDLNEALKLTNPTTHLSHVPVGLDGSNSGVQHYSAIMRAPEGALVNLSDTPQPVDLYGAVATQVADMAAIDFRRVTRALQRLGSYPPTREGLLAAYEALEGSEGHVAPEVCPDAPQGGKVKRRQEAILGALWHLHGITRTTVKRPVMTYGYSAVAAGMSEQVRTDTMAPLSLAVLRGELEGHPFGPDEGAAASRWMGKRVYAAVRTLLPYVASAMDWLQKVAGVLATHNKGVLLTTPLGLPVLHRVTEDEAKRVILMLLGGGEVKVPTRADITIRTGSGDRVVPHKQRSGVAPNVIHACDGSHLQMVTLRLADLGITDLLTTHDCFAVHAAHAGFLGVILREQLVALYRGWDPLENILEHARAALPESAHADLPPLPKRGPVELSAILNANYAFS
jgi:DNA-directed RNA polymerase, mitochondrial